jgi:hypothetical protein
MPSPLVSPEMNIRSPRYYIARTVSTCWHCGSPTALVAIAVPPGHETLDVDDDASDEGSDDETQHREHPAAAWSVADHNAFLFYVDSLPGAVQKRINHYEPAYRPIDADATAAAPATGAGGGSGSYWANHCEQCGCQLDDHELFCEPEGAFLPTSESTAAAIHLVLVDEPFETSAAGYSYEPPLFDAMIRG